MKRIIFFCLLAFSLVGLVSCSSDSDYFGVEERESSSEPLSEFLVNVVKNANPENGEVLAIYDAKKGSVEVVDGDYQSSSQSLLKNGKAPVKWNYAETVKNKTGAMVLGVKLANRLSPDRVIEIASFPLKMEDGPCIGVMHNKK